MSTGQLLGGAGGGVAGYFAAGALGVSTGGAIFGGIIIGSLLGGLSASQKTVMEYGKLSSRNWQGSEYGGDIPRGYGTFPATGSQITWLEHNKLKEKVKKKKSGGKGGGGSTTTKTYTYFATFALMLCQGEVAGVRRIWCGDKLIYNAGSDDLETIIASNQAAKGWKLYRGTDDQLPDPRYEADVGVGNAPAFRGYTYIAFYDFALADYSNTLQAAQFKVELVEQASFTGARMLFQDQIKPVGSIIWTRWPGDGVLPASSAESPEYLVDASDLLISAADGSTERLWTPSANLSRPWTRPGRVITSINVGFGPQTLYPFDDWFLGYAGGDPVFYQYQGSSSPNYFIISCGNRLVYSSSVYAAGGDYVWGIAHDREAGEIYLWMQSPGGRTYRKACSSGGEEDITFNFGTLPSPSRFYSIRYMQGSTAGCIAEENGYIWYYDNTLNRVNICVVDNGVLTIVETISGFDDGSNQVSCFASAGMFYAIARDKIFVFTRNEKINQIKPSLADVITQEACLSSLITASDLDVSLLTQTINGYRVSGGTIRSVIEPLQGAYPFDVVSSGYKIKFVPRGQAPVVTIPWEDLAAANGDEIGDSLPYSREMDSQLPQKVTITAISSTREYGSTTQSS
ncbi:hypothetical protein HBO32_30690, partial [Pseudomonas nitroreducens]|uniref:phage tail protein n=1 Tax=Pseudomonas nitroreducens TaxID=46680 RepID=UPI0018333107